MCKADVIVLMYLYYLYSHVYKEIAIPNRENRMECREIFSLMQVSLYTIPLPISV